MSEKQKNMNEEKVTVGCYISLALAIVFFSGVAAGSGYFWSFLDFTTLMGSAGKVVGKVAESGDGLAVTMTTLRGIGGSGAIDGFMLAISLIVPGVMLAMGMITVFEHYGALRAARKLLTPLLQFLTLGTIHLTGIPTWHGDTVKLKADLKTIDNTQTIKSYEVTGKNVSNICAIFYGYNEIDAAKKSTIESAKDAFSQIIEQINNDKELIKIATHKYNEEQKLKKKIQAITKGKKIDDITLTSNVPSYSDIMNLRKDTIYKIISIPRMYDIPERGFFASQNTHNGNLANYYYQGYSHSGVNKVFFYGKNNYLDGQQIENGYYEYMGIYNYSTILGANKSVPSFRKINIPSNYINIMKNIGI